MKEEVEISGRRDCTDAETKENGIIRRVIGKLRKSKNDKEEEENDASNIDVKVETVQTADENGKPNENDKGDKPGNSSESEEIKKTQTRRRSNNRLIESDTYSPRKTRSHKISGNIQNLWLKE